MSVGDTEVVRFDKWDLRYLRIAREVATWSKDPSTQTGAVIVDGQHGLVSVGFNGFPRNMEDREEWYANREEKYSRIVHCEVNALLHAGNLATQEPWPYTLYTYPFLSCDRCIVQMLQAGITRFVAPEATDEQNVGAAFAKTRAYIADCGDHLECIEVPRNYLG